MRGMVNITRQLNQLQEVDQQLESTKHALEQIASQIGESKVVVEVRMRLEEENEHLEALNQQQHSTEWEIDDLSSKITIFEKKLYSGQVTSPKELTNLQHDIDGLKARRSKLEDKVLEVMDQVELCQNSLAAIRDKYKALEAEWQHEQHHLAIDIENLKAELSTLEGKRQMLAAEIDPETYKFYEELKKQKGVAVVKVEQGICRGCRISLSSTELQRARSGRLVQCSSCGRILFFA